MYVAWNIIQHTYTTMVIINDQLITYYLEQLSNVFKNNTTFEMFDFNKPYLIPTS